MRILLADDSPADRRLAREWLRRQHPGADVVEVDSVLDALGALDRERFDAVFTDLVFHAPGFQGHHVVTVAHARRVPVVVLTGLRALAPSGVQVVDKDALIRGEAAA